MARVLIVDDSPADLMLLRNLLTQAGHAVSEASDGAQAIDTIRMTRPDCVLMDVVMPGVNGFAATRTLSKDPATATLPVIVISSKSADSDRQWAMRQGAKEYFTKPVDGPKLLAAITRLVAP